MSLVAELAGAGCLERQSLSESVGRLETRLQEATAELATLIQQTYVDYFPGMTYSSKIDPRYLVFCPKAI